MTDEDKLINSAKEGGSEAFGKIYDYYMPLIYRFVFLRVSARKADAEDLTHQIFLSAWQNIKNYEVRGLPFSSWLYRIAHNAVIDHYRTQKHHLSLEFVAEDAVTENPEFERSIDTAIEMEGVKAALSKLETDQQNVLIMKFVSELSNKEIAEALGKTEGSIRVIQHRALKQLKKYIDNARGSDPKTE